MTPIKHFVQLNEMSQRLKITLTFRTGCKFMEELSVLDLYKKRNVGVKMIRELMEIYPDLRNEVGIINTNSLKYGKQH